MPFAIHNVDGSVELIDDTGRTELVPAGTSVSDLEAAAASFFPPAPIIVPETISKRQFMQQLAMDGDITWDECFAYLGQGTIPAIFANAIAQIPVDVDANAQNKAKATFIGALTFDRHSQTTVLLGQFLGKSSTEIDQLWINAGMLD